MQTLKSPSNGYVKKNSHVTSTHIFIIGSNFQSSSLFVYFMDKQKQGMNLGQGWDRVWDQGGFYGQLHYVVYVFEMYVFCKTNFQSFFHEVWCVMCVSMCVILSILFFLLIIKSNNLAKLGMLKISPSKVPRFFGISMQHYH